MGNLSEVVSNNFNLLNKNLGLENLGVIVDKSRKNGFLNLIFSEMKGSYKIKDSVLDFLKFLRGNGFVSKKFKKIFLDKTFAFEKLSDSSFRSDLRFLVKKMRNLSNFENFRALSESLSNSKSINKREVITNIENFLYEVNTLFGNMTSLLDFDSILLNLKSNGSELDIEKKDREKNIINVDVKNFKRNNGVIEMLNRETGLRVVSNENFIGKYNIKETFDGTGEFICDLYSSDTAKSDREPFINNINDVLMSEWNLKVNHNIVDKAKIVLKSNDTGEIKLILKPKELGSIRINLNLDSNNNLLGRIIVDNQNVKTLFEQNMYSINKMLDDNGFNTSLSLSLAGSNSGSFSGYFKDKGEDRGFYFDENKVFKLEDDIEISSDLERSINFIV
ncbi:flagellar hook-length control protein FliK [Borrelia sp. A-FGy1]|uniref:flagellar hook-length control protein FliK n=1 Tax=Borrelia sp. A-FGy1 TaxID=2608247 RepID=UPI0015F63B51|nr:flagellar hook-length control protein FliK [Borrelia sp. A-FGy1]QMU99081.1 flagellar hook-length control protein FliK [Borrelia sp. A-FGy1]